MSKTSFWIWGWGFIKSRSSAGSVKQCVSVSCLKALVMLWVFPQEGLWSVASCIEVFPPMRLRITLLRIKLFYFYTAASIRYLLFFYTLLHCVLLCCVFHMKHVFLTLLLCSHNPVRSSGWMEWPYGSFLVGRSTCGLDSQAKFRCKVNKQRKKAHHTVNT